MNKREMIIKVLKDMGLRPKVDSDGDVYVRYELKTIVFQLSCEEENYMNICLYGFRKVIESERIVSMFICNAMNRALRLVNVFVDKDLKSVSAMYDFYFTDEDSLALNVKECLELFGQLINLYGKMKQDYIMENDVDEYEK